jgi:hypothetical protein
MLVRYLRLLPENSRSELEEEGENI